MTLDFGGMTPISHAATITGRAVIQDHLAYDDNPMQVSLGSASRGTVVKKKSCDDGLETIMES